MDGCSKPSHIFLTGEKHAGKSTLVDSITLSTDLSWAGIKSISVFRYNERIKDTCRYIYLTDARNPQVEDSHLIGICCNGKLIESYPEVFDKYGASLLDNADGRQLFVVDEVGFLENSASVYIKKFSQLIERTDLHVLGVLRMDDRCTLYSLIRNNPNVKTFVIKEGNRNNMAPVVNRLLHNIHRD